ncbi:serine carboxypeptidase-like 20 [Solanum verrucosum]|uniref:serine carboxypeptidase-like 20 n=1 Tax=Solanum verrucosum TaxID=315347 RepID=UPI0020D0F060|nr:serine carboxypeptidase-like 20 [Solanum verrucosum]
MARKNIILEYTIVLTLLAFCFLVTEGAPQGALVTQIPGFTGKLLSKHYAGYVNLDESHGKNMYYYFIESERNPSNDPVVLWLNGGPGCSSFDGFVYEHGPFNFELGKANGSLPILHNNPYSWSKVSNIIYLDSPVGVGLSYSKNKADYNTGDLKTATETHAFLLKWFAIYPEFLKNPFYISGESYAGIYVPTLASEVVKGIDAKVNPVINFKGYMVGNGVTDEKIDGNAIVPFQHGMGLISDKLFEDATAACKGDFYISSSQNCTSLLLKISQKVMGLNIYDILEPCYHTPFSTKNSELPMSFRKLGETERPLPVRTRMFGRAWPFNAPVREGLVPSWPELLDHNNVFCTDDTVATAWLNNEDVRKAIHAEPATVTGPWELCKHLNFTHDAGSMIPYHKNLTTQGYRALIYSGDHDMCVPYTGSEKWTSSLGYAIVDEWRPWYTKEKIQGSQQVAGYTQGYANNLTFLTIKGSGHTVPEYKPQESLYFYDSWLQGKKI